MKKALIALLAAVIAAGTATIASAGYVDNTQYLTAGEITSASYPASTAQWPEVTTGQLLKGNIIHGTNVSTENAVSLFPDPKAPRVL